MSRQFAGALLAPCPTMRCNRIMHAHQEPLRVAFDVRGWSAETRGIDTYLRNVLSRWAADPAVELSLLRPRTEEIGDTGVAAPFVSLSFARTLAQKVPALGRPLDAIGRDHDIVFLPNFAVYPKNRNSPVVVTAHDATPLLHPSYFTRSDRFWHWLVNPVELVRSADRVLANSQQTRKEMIELGVDEDRIAVIYLGIDDAYQPAEADAIASVRAKHAIPDGPYYLFLGAVESRKNVKALLRAFRLARQRGLEATLVIAGSVREPDQLVDIGDDVRVLGWIDQADKPALYSGALASVSLAHHEGFGLVPLEAIASGTRSILSPLAIYDETIAEHATYVANDEPDIVAAALINHQQSPTPVTPEQATTLRHKFSWDRCAAETLTQLRSTITTGTARGGQRLP